MKFVAYYTDGYYKGVFEKYLKPSCEKVGVPIIVYEKKNLHDWTLNTRIKAKMLLECLEELKEDPEFIQISNAGLTEYHPHTY